MSNDTMRGILLFVMGITAITTLTFPIMFSRYQWRKSAIGRALMLESASTAVAVSVTFILALLHPSVQLRFVIYLLAFSFIITASARLTWTMLTINSAERTVPPKQKDEALK